MSTHPQWTRFGDMLTLAPKIRESYIKLDMKWYHPDECWSEEFGPFDTRAEAKAHMNEYCFWLDTGLTYYAAQMAHGV